MKLKRDFWICLCLAVVLLTVGILSVVIVLSVKESQNTPSDQGITTKSSLTVQKPVLESKPATKPVVKPSTKPTTKPKPGLVFDCSKCFSGEKMMVKDELKREMFTTIENTFAVRIRVKVTFMFSWKEGEKNKIKLLSPGGGPITLEPKGKVKVNVKFKEPYGEYQCRAFAVVVAG